jgi:hypothetical protein
MTDNMTHDDILTVDQVMAGENSANPIGAVGSTEYSPKSSAKTVALIGSTEYSLVGFLAYLPGAFIAMRGTPANAFETATAVTIWESFEATTRPSKVPMYQVVSSHTGGGKTLAATALIAYLHARKLKCAFVTETVAEVETAYRRLIKLVPSEYVAAWTWAHDRCADAKEVADKVNEDDIDGGVTGGFTKHDLRKRPIVITTHAQYRAEAGGADNGVAVWSPNKKVSRPRHLIVVDEEVRAERTFTRQPEAIAALMRLYSDTQMEADAKSYGFGDTHAAHELLGRIQQRMQDMQAPTGKGVLRSGKSLIEEAEAEDVLKLTVQDVHARAYQRLGKEFADSKFIEETVELKVTVDFLHAAAHGAVFFTRDMASSAFHGYLPITQATGREIILDGTADVACYSLSKSMRIVPGPTPDYSAVQITYVQLPKEFEGRLKPDGIYRNRDTAADFMAWLNTWMLENTEAGDNVLCYGKQRLVEMKLFREWAGAGKVGANAITIHGRNIHFVNFGRGRGSNQWRDCNVYVQLGDFHGRKNSLITKTGSWRGKVWSDPELKALSSGRANHPDYLITSEAQLNVTSKQCAARIRIRNLDEHGKSPAAKLYFVGTELKVMQKQMSVLFPNNSGVKFQGHTPPANWSETDCTEKRGGKTAALRDLLATCDDTVVDSQRIFELTGIAANNIDEALVSREVAPVVALRGWRKSTRKLVGLTGKGYVLTR